MKTGDPGRYRVVKATEEALLAGELVDPKTGRANKLAEDDAAVELEPGDHLWLQLARWLTPAVPPDGSLPTPSEAREVLEHGLGLGAVRHPENRRYVLETLEGYFAGRAAGLAERFEKPEKKKDRGGRRSRTPPRKRHRR
jgi:hypothetical protein